MADPTAKGGLLEPPAMARHVQVRPAFLGWQWRVSVKGEVFSPWMFALSRRRAERAYSRHRPEMVEDLP